MNYDNFFDFDLDFFGTHSSTSDSDGTNPDFPSHGASIIDTAPSVTSISKMQNNDTAITETFIQTKQIQTQSEQIVYNTNNFSREAKECQPSTSGSRKRTFDKTISARRAVPTRPTSFPQPLQVFKPADQKESSPILISEPNRTKRQRRNRKTYLVQHANNLKAVMTNLFGEIKEIVVS